MMTRHGMHKEAVGVLLFGGLVGAGAALMTAPGSGKETRQRIGEFAEDVKERTECYVYRAKGQVTSALERGKELLQEKKSIMATAFKAGRDAYEKEKGKICKRTLRVIFTFARGMRGQE